MNYRFSAKFVDIGSIVLVKFSTLGLTAYSLLFLTFVGGLTSVGHYSAVTAITAPIGMFCTFRHVEWISLSQNKGKAFSISIIVAIAIFLISSPFLIILLINQIDNYLFILILVLFKPLELASSYFSTLFLCEKNQQAALISSVLKIALVLSISLGGLFLGIKDIEILIASSMFLSFAVVLLSYDLKHVIRYDILIPSKRELFIYLRSNFSLGVLNLVISLNSSLPRYYLIFHNDMATLGFFSIIYQISATLTNLIQHVISIKIITISHLLRDNRRILNTVLWIVLGLLAIATLVLYGHYVKFPIPFYLTISSLISTITIIALMFIFLILRGLYISLSIANSRSRILFPTVLCSSFVSILFLFLTSLYRGHNYPLNESFMFVLLSSFVSILILQKNIFCRGTAVGK